MEQLKFPNLKEGEGVDKLTLRPIISNIGYATYETARYLAELLAPLGKSEHTISNTKDFITRLKTERIPKRFKVISFYVKSLFTNVPLEETIDVILNKIYDEKEIEASIPRNTMKDLLYLCMKNVHFTYDGKIYIQINGVVMGSPFGPLLVNIFMISLEEAILPSIKKHVAHWKRYVDDTHPYIDPSKTELVLEKLNNHYPNIHFTHGIEKKQKITFLDVLITRTGHNKLETTVFRKETNTDLYINWNTHAPIQWKRGALKNLIQRSILICSNGELLEDGLNYLGNVFIKVNDYPPKLINSIIKIELEKDSSDQQKVTSNAASKQIQLVLPYADKCGSDIIWKMNRQLHKHLKDYVKVMTMYQGTKLSSRFQVKDQTKFEHNDIVYCCKCPENNCDVFYIRETDRRISKRIIDHNKRDRTSHPLQYVQNKKQPHAWVNDLTIF